MLPSDLATHDTGSTDCATGWCGNLDGYPKSCTCGGLIHAELAEEHMDGYSLDTMCDKCGKAQTNQ